MLFIGMNSSLWLGSIQLPTQGSYVNYTSKILISTGTTVGVSMVLWLIAAILILALKLLTKLIYRLNLYQILSILFLLVIFEVCFTTCMTSVVHFLYINLRRRKSYALLLVQISFSAWGFHFISLLLPSVKRTLQSWNICISTLGILYSLMASVSLFIEHSVLWTKMFCYI